MTDLKKLSEVFEKRIFVIPDYQRGYAWTDEQLVDLTEDLEDLQRIHQQGRQKYLHYTGTIVAKRGMLAGKPQCRVNAVTYEIFEIVDGQQRITTLVIFLHEIAAFLEILGYKASADNIKENYIEIQPGMTWRLNLNGALDGFFKANVLRDGTGNTTQPAEKNLLDAKTFFRSYLEKKKRETSDQFAAYLDELCGLITDALGFVWHEVGGEHEVSVIFETMNSRGKLLTQFEKVKNLLFFLAGRYANESELTALTTQINQTWSFVLTTLYTGAPHTDEDQLLRYFWAIYPGAAWFEDNQRERTFNVHRAIKETAKTKVFTDAPGQWMSGFLFGVRDYVTLYRDILKPDHPHSFASAPALRNDFITVCQSIKRIGREANLVPLLMAAYHEFQSTAAALTEVFRLVEVFSFRLLLQGRYASTGRGRAFEVAADIAAKRMCVDQAQSNIRTHLLDYYCDDSTFEKRLNDNTINFYEWSGIRYFLFEYECHCSKNNTLPIDWDAFMKLEKQQTIEHILPQGDNTLDEPYWRQHFPTREAWKDNVHRLGNLCLTEWNASLSNKPFPCKCGSPLGAADAKVYRNSKFGSERELTTWSVWNKQSIDERQAKLVQFALDRWKK